MTDVRGWIMSAISQRDYERALDCVGQLYEVEDPGRFPAVALTELLKLVGAESSTFNYLAPAVPKVVTVAIPELPDQARRTERFSQYLPQHSVLSHYLDTGNPGTFKLSDFESRQAFHALPLYGEFYREIGYEDQFSFFLAPPGPELIGISLARNRRSFTERDRELLDLLRPHLARAYRHVERTGRLSRALASGPAELRMPLATRVIRVWLDSRDRPLHLDGEAQRWLQKFFPDPSRDRAQLPQDIRDWLARRKGAGAKGHPAAGREPALVREHIGQRLRVTRLAAESGDGCTLLLDLETPPESARGLLGHGLTPREIEVLLQVEQGKTNKEVSAALGISPLTVRCHLERIFEKLRVSSRTAAATRFRSLCRGGGGEGDSP